MRARFSAAAALAIAGALSISCGGIVDPSKNTVETFSGTITPGTGVPMLHAFSSSKTGEISVKFTALSPSSSVYMGVAWTQGSSDGSCTAANLGLILQNYSFAQLNLPAISGQIFSGKYCIAVYESSPLSVPENYTVTVSHP